MSNLIYRYLFYPNKNNINKLYYIDDEVKNDVYDNNESSLWLIYPVNKLYFNNKILSINKINNKIIIGLNNDINNRYPFENYALYYEKYIYDFKLIDNIFLKLDSDDLYFTLDAFAYLVIQINKIININFLNIKNFGLSLLYCSIKLGIATSTIINQTPKSEIKDFKINNNDIKFNLHPEDYVSTTLENQKIIINSCIENKNILVTGSTGVGKTKVIPKLISLFNLYFSGYDIKFFNLKKCIYNLNIKYKTTFIIAPKKLLIKSIANNLYKDLGFNKIEGSPVKLNYKRYNDEFVVKSTDINKSFKKFKTPIIVSIDVLAIREMDNIKTLIVDEVHEHSKFSDISTLIAIKKKIQLTLISATIEDELIHIKKIIPNIVHINLEGNTRFNIENIIVDKNVNVVDIIKKEMKPKKSIIWFLPTKKIIKDRSYLIKNLNPDLNLNVIELYSETYQDSISNNIDITNEIENSEKPILVLSTNIAESSITINNAIVVIDEGTVYVKKFYSGEVITINNQMALQRKGRVGRVSEGKYYYLGKKHVSINKLDFDFLYTYILCNLKFNIPIESFFYKPSDISRVHKSIIYLKSKKIYLERDYENIFYITQNEFCSLFEYVYAYMNYSNIDISIVRKIDKSYGNVKLLTKLYNYNKKTFEKLAKDINIILIKNSKFLYNIKNHFENILNFNITILNEENEKDKKLYMIYPNIGLYT